MKLPAKAAPVVFAFYMAAIMALLMCSVIVGIGQGFSPGLPAKVFRAYAVAMPTAFVCVLVVRPLVMRLVAAPAAMGHRGVSRGIGLGLAVGFLYLITDGLATAAGQARLLPALLAAWVPTLAFASIGATGLIWLEDKG